MVIGFNFWLLTTVDNEKENCYWSNFPCDIVDDTDVKILLVTEMKIDKSRTFLLC